MEQLKTSSVKIGQATCLPIHDFTRVYDAGHLAINEKGEDVRHAFPEYGMLGDHVDVDYTPLLVRHGGKNILLDTGIGYYSSARTLLAKPEFLKGRLTHQLREHEVPPEEIDIVVLSHLHPDHIGGNFDEDGRLNFPNATFVMGRDEWAFWRSDASRAMPESFHAFIRENIDPLDDSAIVLIEEEEEVVDGLRAFSTPGHTPGHLSFMLDSDGQRLIYAADTILSRLHLEHLEVRMGFDVDHDQARHSREKVLSLAVEHDAIIHAYHIDFPGLGRVSRQKDGFRWEPLQHA